MHTQGRMYGGGDCCLKVNLDLEFNTYATEESRIALRTKDIADSMVVVYLDTRYDGKPFSIIGPLENFSSKITLTGTLKRAHKHRIEKRSVPSDTRICVQTYRLIENENGDYCWVDNGMCTFLLTDNHIAFHDTTPYYKSSPRTKRMERRSSDLVMKTVHEDTVKGRITLNRINGHLERHSGGNYSVTDHVSKGKVLPMSFYPSPRLINNVKSEQNGFEHAMTPYFKQYMEESKLFAPSIIGTDKIKCPFCPSEDTFADNRTEFSPLAAYMFYPKPQVSIGYWVQALKIATDRMGKSIENMDQFYESPIDEDVNEKANFAVKLCAQYAQLFDYVSDTSVDSRTGKKTGIEMFGDALRTLCGDCEDLSLAVYAMAENMAYHVSIPSLNEYISIFGTNAGWLTLHYVRWFLRCYVPVLTIDGVSSAHVNKKTNDDNGEVRIDGAHGAIVFFPMDYFSQALSRWEPNQIIVKEIEKQMIYRLNELQHITRRSIMLKDQFKSFLSTLPVLMGEGTGLLNPLAKTDAAYDLNRDMSASELLRKKVKRELVFPVENNPFYKAILFGTSTLFMERLPVQIGTFRFTYVSPDSQFNDAVRYPSNKALSTGILFSDLINKRADIAVIPYGMAIKNGPNAGAVMPLTTSKGEMVTIPVEFSAEQMNYIKLSSVVRVPPLPVTITEEAIQDEKDKNSDRGKPRLIVNMEDRINRMLGQNGDMNAETPLLKRRCYVKEVNMNKRLADEMVALVGYLLRKRIPIHSFDVTYEKHSIYLGMWRISFFFK